jgi:hypothetical protein
MFTAGILLFDIDNLFDYSITYDLSLNLESMNPQIDAVVSVFCRLANQNVKKLEHGRDLRIAMHEAIVKGQKPVGYRPAFLRESSQVVISLLGELAEEFDQQHQDDKASLHDLMDVLATAVGLLKREIDGDD